VKRAYVEVTDNSVEIGTEHLPMCPNREEPDETKRARPSELSEHHVEYACDAATRAIEDAEPYWRRFLRNDPMRGFLVEWGIVVPRHLYRFDGMTHSQFECCKWSCAIMDIAAPAFIEAAATAARGYLAANGYAVVESF